jgi:hypothetical protein
MEPFNVGFISNYKVINENDSVVIQLKSEDIKNLTLPRKEWTKKNLNDSLIWLGGGGSYLINNRYIVMVRRSITAPTNPGKVTLLTGLSDSKQEWNQPTLLKRELFEEVIFVDSINQKFFWPQIESDSLSVIKEALKDTPYEHFQGEALKSEWISSLAKDKVIIDQNVFHGLIHLNGNHFNFLFCCKVEIPLALLSTLDFFDSEYEMVAGEKKFLRREVYFYDLNDEILLNNKFNKTNVSEITSQAEHFLEMMKKNKSWRKNG